MIASSSNGRTADSDSVNLGSSPGEAANKNTTFEEVFLLASLNKNRRKSAAADVLEYKFLFYND